MDLTSLIPTLGGYLWTFAAFVVALSIIVAVHEYGHYIIGRLSGIKADVFSVGFGKVLASRVDRHGTRWQIAALPFGGYVKFRGDADAASGKDVDAMEALTPQDRRETMHGAPLWARAATVLAGPVFNFILTILIVTVISLSMGRPGETIVIDEVFDVPQAELGLQSGDELLAVNGVAANTPEEFSAAVGDLDPTPTLTYTVERDGARMDVEGAWFMPARVGSVQPKSAAIDAGLEVGDVVLSIDGTPIYAFGQMPDLIEEGEGSPKTLEVWRDGDVRTMTLTPRVRDVPNEDGGFDKRYLIGIAAQQGFTIETQSVGVGEALWTGVVFVGNLFNQTVNGIGSMITGQISTCNLSGPLTIAQVSGDTASMGWLEFFSFVAAISTAIGLVNLLPIPVLDGGHLVFHAYEAVAGRPPSDRVLQVLMAGGLTLMLMLMVFAVFNDLVCV